MAKNDLHEKVLQLENEVKVLDSALRNEQKVKKILKCTDEDPFVRFPYLSTFLPLQVQLLLAEVALAEEEIWCLERKVEALKNYLYHEKRQKKSSFYRMQMEKQYKQRCMLYELRSLQMLEQDLLGDGELNRQTIIKERSKSVGSTSEFNYCTKIRHVEAGISSICREDSRNQNNLIENKSTYTPNKLSEVVVQNLISIFHKLNHTPSRVHCESTALPKLHISCMNTRSLVPFHKTYNDTAQKPEICGILQDNNERLSYKGSHVKYIQITQRSLDFSGISACISNFDKLRILMRKLSTVDLTFLSYKQKLAFWINIYNACIMHKFLQSGLPISPDRQLELLNKAEVNVGGLSLNALAIEHYILRHSLYFDDEDMDEKEELLRHSYGLAYPEPNVMFALCRGSWSSPAMRVYTAENVVDELERAKVEYLEASVRITSKKKISIPKLLYWHMKDFADDIESLMEWIYSQLPKASSLKRSIMECLNGGDRTPLRAVVEIKPYEAEFRYLLPI